MNVLFLCSSYTKCVRHHRSLKPYLAMTAAEATFAPSKRNISLLAQQTLAQPKHSLFGTTLEHYEKKELPSIVAIKANPTDMQRQSQQYPVPDHLKHFISGTNFLKHF